MIGPCLFGLPTGRDARKTLLAQVLDAVGYPFDILLDTSGDVAKRGSIVRADQHKKIREAGALNAKVGARPIGPFVLE